jgi:16S rRNA (guanine527-N7)-methyltransferase
MKAEVQAMTPRELLITGAKELGIDFSVEQVNSLFIYMAELKKWNRKINLTAIRDERDMIIKHVLDSLSYIKGFDPSERMRLLDMGSGAGFPALPIAVAMPGISVTLVESVKKKTSFLRHIIRTLELTGAEVIDKRTEELHVSSQASYDVVTARAFATMVAALTAGAPFLKADGLMVLSRGPEEAIGEKEFLKAGVILKKRIELTLPHSDYRRAIWVFKKTG